MKLQIALLVAAASAAPALAGLTATTGTDPVLTPDSGPAGASVGDTFSTATAGTIAAYLADTPLDPQITGGDLNYYRCTLNGSVAAVLGPVVTYTGSYQIFYDLDLNGVGGTDIPSPRACSASMLPSSPGAPPPSSER